MSPSIDPKYIPKQWRPIYTFAMLAAMILAAAGTALAAVHVEAGRVVESKWDDKFRSEVKTMATEAATDAARDAVTRVTREEIAPLKERLDRHEPYDDQRVHTLEATVSACCPVAPRGPYSSAPTR